MEILMSTGILKKINIYTAHSLKIYKNQQFVTGCMECVHIYRDLEMQSMHFWPIAVNA